MTQHKVYIASGFFNDTQKWELTQIEAMLDALNVPYFSPRKHCICPPDASAITRQKTFLDNVMAIDDAEYVIVNTRDKDMGTIFEAGLAYGWAKQIIYFANGMGGQFNLMLAESGACVCTSVWELHDVIANIAAGTFTPSAYKGNIE